VLASQQLLINSALRALDQLKLKVGDSLVQLACTSQDEATTMLNDIAECLRDTIEAISAQVRLGV
jgi:hypothetical protein